MVDDIKYRSDMTRAEFQLWLESIPVEETEPFCPFPFVDCYCNTAYSMKCYDCAWRVSDKTN